MAHRAVTRRKQVASVSLTITVCLFLSVVLPLSPLSAPLKTIWWFGEHHCPPAWVFCHENLPRQHLLAGDLQTSHFADWVYLSSL